MPEDRNLHDLAVALREAINSPERKEVGWQVYVEALLMEKQRALDAALAAQKEAVVKAEIATDRIAARAMSDQEALRGEMAERLSALRRELEAATAAQKEAVIKAETATEKRFESVNEWRDQSADRERTQQEDRAKLEGAFIRREVIEAQLASIRDEMVTLRSRSDVSAGGDQSNALLWTRMLSIAAVLASVGAIVALIVHG
jgi:hypothetical protein